MSRLTASAVESIEQEICRKIQRSGELQDELTRVDGQIEELRDLLKYASCPRCGSEIVGYITDVVDYKNEAKAAGRKDGTCPSGKGCITNKCQGHLCRICRQIMPCDRLSLSPSSHGPQDCRDCLALMKGTP